MLQLQKSKGADYNKDKNFSTVINSALNSGMSPELGFLFMLNVKLERLNNLTLSSTFNHESIEDTLVDLANYANGLYDYTQEKRMQTLS